MLPLSLLLLFVSATAVTGKMLDTTLVVLSGDTVKLTCNSLPAVNLSWYYFNHTLGEYHIVLRGLNLVFQATVENSGKYLCSHEPREIPSSHTINLTVVERLAKLQVVATPSHPVVMEGQPVVLHCHASTSSLAVNWSWYMIPLNRYENEMMYTGRDVVISRPEDSGSYHCMAQSLLMGINQTATSSQFLIQVVAMPKTGLALVDHLGLAGFGLSLLGWLILLAALLWFARGGYGTSCPALQEVTSSSAKAKGLTASKMATSDGLPHAESQGDYMNYTNTNLAYVDLKPNSMNGYDVYSSLS